MVELMVTVVISHQNGEQSSAYDSANPFRCIQAFIILSLILIGESDSLYPGIPRMLANCFLALSSATGAVSFILNCMVIIVMLREKKLRENSANQFILAIASADLVYGIFFPIAFKMV